MTGDQYKYALDVLGLSQRRAARLFGVNERTSRRWARGENPVRPVVALFLVAMIHWGKTADDLYQLFEPA